MEDIPKSCRRINGRSSEEFSDEIIGEMYWISEHSSEETHVCLSKTIF